MKVKTELMRSMISSRHEPEVVGSAETYWFKVYSP